ncbi:MAG: YtfJ family protein [Deltaproteobacteria bacterium]|nr:YtfJ family protein [Deltaproteobacteria bacterium]
MIKLIIIIIFSLIPFTAFSELPVGEIPPKIVLSGQTGGKLDGTAWNSESLKDIIFILFYVDPDEKDLNVAVSQAIKKENFPRDEYGSVAVINMAATWLPNMAIASSLEKKQKEFPYTLYVKDLKKVLVDQWNLRDDSNDILLFGKDGKVLFSKDGKLSQQDIDKMLGLIRSHL